MRIRRSAVGSALFISMLAVSLAFAQSGSKPAPASKKATTKDAGVREEIKKGKATFDTNCEICHYSGTLEKKIGPGLKGIFKRGKFSDGKKVDDASMRRWIEDGGKDMPSFKDLLTSSQINDLIAYLKTL